ncbi:hypothetical protein GC197_03635 [bacterium]|nr:hypothetical protein [bacterium]
MQRQIFPARIDWWITLLLAGLAIATLSLGIAFFLIPDGSYLGGTLMLLTAALLQSIWMWTWYEIGETDLNIRCGPLWWRVPLEEINQATPSDSIWPLMGGPHLRFALSSQAIMIHYGERKWLGLFRPAVLISPQDRQQFLTLLKQSAPNLRSDDQK